MQPAKVEDEYTGSHFQLSPSTFKSLTLLPTVTPSKARGQGCWGDAPWRSASGCNRAKSAHLQSRPRGTWMHTHSPAGRDQRSRCHTWASNSVASTSSSNCREARPCRKWNQSAKQNGFSGDSLEFCYGQNENKRKWKSSGKEITLTRGRTRTTSSAIIASSVCFHPDICVQTKFVAAVPLLSVVVSGGGVSEAWSGHGGGALGRCKLLQKTSHRFPSLSCSVSTQRSGSPESTLIPPHGHPDPPPPNSSTKGSRPLLI